MKQMLLALLNSRKFWLTVLSLGASVALYVKGGLSAPQLADVLAASVAALVLAIAHEDSGSKSATQAAGGNIVNVSAPVVPAERPTVPALEESK